MNRTPWTRTALLAVAATFLTVSCSSKPKAVTSPEVKPMAVADAPVRVTAPTTKVEPLVETPVGVSVSVEELNRKGYLKDAFFDYNRYDIRPDQRDALAKNAVWLREHPSVKITVEGHCDERGTSQYNMALGEQRAQAVKEYLVQLGIEASRIQIISFGNERPFEAGHDEKAWAQNRRDHFVMTAS